MPYTQPTFAAAKAALASRLNDPSMVRYVDAELGTYIREALRVWSAWTQHWREQASLTTVVNQAFYDLPTAIPSLRGYTVTNWDLIADLQYTLLEPAAAGGTWTGTDQFTLDQLSTAIWRRRDQFLRETGCVVTQAVTNYTPPASGRVTLDEAVVQVRRAAWRTTATQVLYPLQRTDEWAANNFKSSWQTSVLPPTAYSVSVTPPLELQIIPPPSGAGDLDLLSINIGATVDPLVAAALNIPDDFAWVVKYGALADLLQGDGLALDPQRANYAEQRWQQGVAVARAAAVVLTGQINSQPITLASVNDADSYAPTWQLVSGVPRKLLLAGGNLVASWPPPGVTGGPWTFTLDVVRNAPVPAVDADVLQIAYDVYDSILDYAQHVALTKEGPGQTELANALLSRAAAAAGVELTIQQATQPSRAPLLEQTLQDEHAVARGLEPVEIR